MSSSDSNVDVRVSAYGNASMQIRSESSAMAMLQLVRGNSSFTIQNNPFTNQLQITDHSRALLSIEKDTGSTVLRGNVLVGGSDTAGPRTVTVSSADAAATFEVKSGGTGDSSILVESPAGRYSKLTLSEEGGESFTMLNDGVKNELQLRDGSYELLTLAPETGNMYVRGDLTIGGVSPGSRSATIQSMAGETELPKTALADEGKLTLPATLKGETTLTVCYATKETLGDGSSDFASLSMTYLQYAVHVLPSRTFAGIDSQIVTIAGLSSGDYVQLSLKANSSLNNNATCSAYNMSTAATSTNSVWGYVPLLGSLSSVSIQLYPALMVQGDYLICRQTLSQQVASVVTGASFSIRSSADFYPFVVAQAFATQLHISGGSIGDIVVVKQNGCTNAATSVQTVLDSQMVVAVSSQLPVAQYTVCIAPAESLGDEDQDFDSITRVLHVISTTLAVDRVVVGSGPHSVNLTNTDQIAVAVAQSSTTCNGTLLANSAAGATSLTVPSTLGAGLYQICVKILPNMSRYGIRLTLSLLLRCGALTTLGFCVYLSWMPITLIDTI